MADWLVTMKMGAMIEDEVVVVVERIVYRRVVG